MSPGYKASTPGALVGHLATCPCASLPHAARHQLQNEVGHRLQRIAAHPEKEVRAFDAGANAIAARASQNEKLIDVQPLIQPPLLLIQLFQARRSASTASLGCTSFSSFCCACKAGSISKRATAREAMTRGAAAARRGPSSDGARR